MNYLKELFIKRRSGNAAYRERIPAEGGYPKRLITPEMMTVLTKDNKPLEHALLDTMFAIRDIVPFSELAGVAKDIFQSMDQLSRNATGLYTTDRNRREVLIDDLSGDETRIATYLSDSRRNRVSINYVRGIDTEEPRALEGFYTRGAAVREVGGNYSYGFNLYEYSFPPEREIFPQGKTGYRLQIYSYKTKGNENVFLTDRVLYFDADGVEIPDNKLIKLLLNSEKMPSRARLFYGHSLKELLRHKTERQL